MRISKITLLKYVAELLIVAFGVFLGMMVSDYNTQKNTKKNVTKSVVFIREELKRNSEILNQNINYHNEIKKAFDSLKNVLPGELALEKYYTQTQFRYNRIPSWRGLGMGGLENIAFESAKISGVFQEMDIGHVQKISWAYQNIAAYDHFTTSIMDKLLELNSESLVLDAMKILEILSADVILNEESIKKEIDKTYAQLEKIGNK